MTRGRIDTHHHIYPPKYLADAHDQIARATHVHFPRIAAWTPAQSLEAMDRDGIASAIVSISPSLWFGDIAATRKIAREWNEYAADLARDHRGRFAVFAALPLPDVEASVAEIAHALDTLGAVGFGLVTNYGDKWPGDPAFAPVFDELNRRKAVVYTHPHTPLCCLKTLTEAAVPDAAIEYGTDTTRAIANYVFSGTSQRCPDLKLIWSHAGGTMPFLIERFMRTATFPEFRKKLPGGFVPEAQRFYYDIAQASNKVALSCARQVIPASHFVFGTDYPYRSAKEHVEGLKQSGVFDNWELRGIDRTNLTGILPQYATDKPVGATGRDPKKIGS
jgi:predicted TIM-barrel fold metal-dependent hydrolase